MTNEEILERILNLVATLDLLRERIAEQHGQQ